MKIAVFETEHFETVYPVLRLLEDHDITLFVTRNVASQLYLLLGNQSDKIHWVIREENTPFQKFIQSTGQYCNENAVEHLLLNTVSGSFIFFARMVQSLDKTAAFLVLHDINNFLLSRPSFSIRKLVRHWGKKLLLQRCKGFFTISINTTEYLKSINPYPVPVHWMPGAIFEKGRYETPPALTPFRLQLVVPGSLDSRRRNYQEVFRLVDHIIKEKMPVDICLLGGYGSLRDTGLLNACLQYSRHYSGFRYFDEKEVSQSVFSYEMNKSHFIWIPSVINTSIADGIPETYGRSKSSGNLFDAVRYARPMLIPKELNIDSWQENAACRYDSLTTLAGFLKGICQQPDSLKEWQKKAVEMASQYDPLILKTTVSKIFNSQ